MKKYYIRKTNLQERIGELRKSGSLGEADMKRVKEYLDRGDLRENQYLVIEKQDLDGSVRVYNSDSGNVPLQERLNSGETFDPAVYL